MRLREFTNAEEQLGLLKQILDCSWRAIADQAAAQKKEQELKRAQAASKPRAKRSSAPARANPHQPSPAPQPHQIKRRQTLKMRQVKRPVVHCCLTQLVARRTKQRMYQFVHILVTLLAAYGANG